jgi:uncharacterized protein (UPF0332 family)
MKVDDCLKRQLLIKKKPSFEKAQKSLDAAEAYIKKAKDNLKIKNFDIVIVISCTSMFHSLRSILFKDGMKERSHTCLLSYVKERYPEFSSIVNSADIYRRFRHTALYGLEAIDFEDEAETSIEVAEEIYDAVRGKILV